MVRYAAVILESRKHRDPGRCMCSARQLLKHPELVAARFPTVIEVTSEAAIFSVNAAREPGIQHGPQCMLQL